MEQLSEHLTLTAATQSSTASRYGIVNRPNALEISRLQDLGKNVYDPMVAEFGLVYLSSVFRCPQLNSKVGGSATSGHLRGECLDADGDSPSPRYTRVDNIELFQWIKRNLQFDQLIAEFVDNGAPRWSHVGYRTNNRGQVLIASKDRYGRTVYLVYTDKLFNQIYKRSRSFSFGTVDAFEVPEIEEIFADETLGTDFDNEVLGNRNMEDIVIPPITAVPPLVEMPTLDIPEVKVITEQNNPATNPTVLIAGDFKVTITLERI